LARAGRHIRRKSDIVYTFSLYREHRDREGKLGPGVGSRHPHPP
jgi:hypothetical protein